MEHEPAPGIGSGPPTGAAGEGGKQGETSCGTDPENTAQSRGPATTADTVETAVRKNQRAAGIGTIAAQKHVQRHRGAADSEIENRAMTVAATGPGRSIELAVAMKHQGIRHRAIIAAGEMVEVFQDPCGGLEAEKRAESVAAARGGTAV